MLPDGQNIPISAPEGPSGAANRADHIRTPLPCTVFPAGPLASQGALRWQMELVQTQILRDTSRRLCPRLTPTSTPVILPLWSSGHTLRRTSRGPNTLLWEFTELSQPSFMPARIRVTSPLSPLGHTATAGVQVGLGRLHTPHTWGEQNPQDSPVCADPDGSQAPSSQDRLNGNNQRCTQLAPS